jgi:hypothetical protein
MASGKKAALGAAAKAPSGDGGTGSQTPTRCDQGGDEIIVTIISLKQNDPVELDLTLCRSDFRVRVFLDDKRLFDGEAQNQLNILIDETDLLPGLHTLTWAYLPANTDSWQVLSELSVSRGVRFRMRKGAPDSDIPSTQRFVLLRVQ